MSGSACVDASDEARLPVSEHRRPSLDVYLREGWHERDLCFGEFSNFVRERVPTDRDIFSSEDRRRPRPPQEAWRSTFGLTPAVAKLAASIAAGESIESAAGEFGVARRTARNQLEVIFPKTGAARQSELIALMRRMLAADER